MRLFERESNVIREAAYQNFLVYRCLWDEVARIYMNSDEDVDCPEAHRAYARAFNQKAIADFLDPQSKYDFYARFNREYKINRVGSGN